MPFIDVKPTVQNASAIAPDDNESDPTAAQTFGAAFRTQNVVGSYLHSRGMPDPYQIDEGFNAIDYVKDQPEFAPHVEEFAGIFNQKAADAKKAQILQEEADRRTLDAAGTMGTVAQLAAGVIDAPTLLAPGSFLLGGGRGALATAGRMAVAGGIDAAVTETALQETQATRTAEETALNIGGSIIISGALGGLAGRYLANDQIKPLSQKIENQEAEFDRFDTAFASAGRNTSVGAAATDVGPLKLKDENLINNPVFRAAGVTKQDPLIRLQLSEMDSARATVRGLAETPLEYADNAAGIATERGGSVETRMKLWHAPEAQTLKQIDVAYAKYFNDAPEPSAWQVRLSPLRSEFARVRGGQKMTYKQFKEEVGRAAFSGEQHAIPEVAEAARFYREFDDAMKNAAIEAKLLDKDVTVKGDVSHLFRMYNHAKIIAQRNRFAEILHAHFISARDASLNRANENQLADRVSDLDRKIETYRQSADKLAGIEQRLSERATSRSEKLGNLNAESGKRLDLLNNRPPRNMVEFLKDAGENDAAVATIKDAQAATRKLSRKGTSAERYPVISILKDRGGVREGSSLSRELKAMGVTSKDHPGLFKKNGGNGAADNVVWSEHPVLRDNLQEGANGYADPNDLLEAIRREVAGDPLRTIEDMNLQANAEAMIENAEAWLERAGLGKDAKVKDVREFIRNIQKAERDVGDIDTRIEKLEREIEEFDQVTDRIVNERIISDAEARSLSDEITKLEEGLAEFSQQVNASPRISMMVDYANNARRLFKKRMQSRNLSKRIDALQRVVKEGKATDEIHLELSAKQADMRTLEADIAKLGAKTDALKEKIPTAAEKEKADEFGNLSDAELRDVVDETINTILGNAQGRIPYDSIVSGPRGALKERVLNIESSKIADFLNLDIEEVLRSQVRTMSADVEIARKFGSVDMAEQLRKIDDEADAKIALAKTDKERTQIEKGRKAAKRDVEAIRDRLRGQYALPSDPDGIVLRAGRVARNLNYMRLLGGMTISALPDMAGIILKHGMTSTFRDGFIPLVTNYRTFRMAAEEVKQAGTALDMILDSRAMALADITGEFGRHSAFERGLSAVSSKFGVVTLMAPWNAAMKQFSGMVVMTNILRSAERVARGAGTADDIRKLAAGNIDADMAARIVAEFKQHGDNQGGIMLAKAAAWADNDAREAFRVAVVRDVDRIIVTPGQDKPLWMSTELGKTVGQFKTFGVASMQRILLSGMQQRDAATLNGVMVSMALGATAYWAKQTAAGRDLSDNPAVWAVEAFDKSGMAGWLMDANNIAEKASRGRVGLSALTGEQVSRYASRNVTGAFLGPTPEAVADIFQISGSIFARDTTKADLKRLRQMVPLQNVFYLRSLFNQLEQDAGDALNLPETKSQ